MNFEQFGSFIAAASNNRYPTIVDVNPLGLTILVETECRRIDGQKIDVGGGVLADTAWLKPKHFHSWQEIDRAHCDVLTLSLERLNGSIEQRLAHDGCEAISPH